MPTVPAFVLLALACLAPPPPTVPREGERDPAVEGPARPPADRPESPPGDANPGDAPVGGEREGPASEGAPASEAGAGPEGPAGESVDPGEGTASDTAASEGPASEAAREQTSEAAPSPPPPSFERELPVSDADADAPGSDPFGSEPEPGSDPFAGGPEPEPDVFDEIGRDFADLPLAPTAAMKSSSRRNNDVLTRPFRRPVYSVAAAARLAVLVGGGADIIQPVGWGVAFQLRLHFLRVLKSRFGVEIYGGHARFSERGSFETFEGSEITRVSLLTHTDFSAGPSLQIPIGPVFVQFGGSAGVAISTLLRPRSADSSMDETLTNTDFGLRGGASLNVPILNRHGITVGSGVHHLFSRREVTIDLDDAEGDTTRPFSTWVEVFAGYQIWF